MASDTQMQLDACILLEVLDKADILVWPTSALEEVQIDHFWAKYGLPQFCCNSALNGIICGVLKKHPGVNTADKAFFPH